MAPPGTVGGGSEGVARVEERLDFWWWWVRTGGGYLKDSPVLFVFECYFAVSFLFMLTIWGVVGFRSPARRQ